MIPPHNSSTFYGAPWYFFRCPQVLLTHQLLDVSTNKNKSKYVKYDEQRGLVCGTWRTIQLLPMKYSVTRQQKCEGEQSCCWHVSSDLRRTSFLRMKWWIVLYETQAIVWCSTSVAMNVPIWSSQKRPHYNAAEEECWKILQMWWLEFLVVRRWILWQVASNLALRLTHQKPMWFTSRCCSKDQRRKCSWSA
jgi:hypothetical protein